MMEAVLEIPEPLSVCDVRLDNRTVTTIRQHGTASGPRLVLSHGSGLAIDLYYPFWSLLADDCELIVYDLRNHGWNSVGAAKDHNIPTLVRDHDIILDRIDGIFGSKPTVGVYHSLATIVPLLSFTEPYSALVLFDHRYASPARVRSSCIRPLNKRLRRSGGGDSGSRRGKRLPNYFATYRPSRVSLRVCATSWPRQPSGWRRAGKDMSFAARAEYEAQLMDYARSFFPLIDLKLISCPAKIIGADPTLPYAYLPTLDFSDMMEVDYDFIPEATHLLQLEKPEECASAVFEFLNGNGLF